MAVNLRSFKRKIKYHRTRFKRFLSRIESMPPRNLFTTLVNIDKEVWKETDCTSCANCCKTMSPTYSDADVKRIARYFKMTTDAFRKKWLRKDKEGDWLNKHTPCQFLDLHSNKCTIYSIRPADCKGFPHLTKKKVTDYFHIHKQNIDSCPATFRMVEKLMETVSSSQPAINSRR
jgi:Fe-S-cluster containining protein